MDDAFLRGVDDTWLESEVSRLCGESRFERVHYLAVSTTKIVFLMRSCTVQHHLSSSFHVQYVRCVRYKRVIGVLKVIDYNWTFRT